VGSRSAFVRSVHSSRRAPVRSRSTTLMPWALGAGAAPPQPAPARRRRRAMQTARRIAPLSYSVALNSQIAMPSITRPSANTAAASSVAGR
jgi:hypothetical protein